MGGKIVAKRGKKQKSPCFRIWKQGDLQLLSTSAHAQRSGQCRQHRHDDLYHRLPKFLVLHNCRNLDVLPLASKNLEFRI